MGGHLLRATVIGINLAECSAQTLFGIIETLPGAWIGRWVLGQIVAGTGSGQRPLIWEVTVDRQAFDASQLRNGTDGGLSYRLVEVDRRLDNASSSRLL